MKIIDIQDTPNPNAMKFVLDAPLTVMGVTRMFHSAEDAEGVPLADELFAIEHVESVYFADRWLTVTQDGGADWHGLLREVAVPIRGAESPRLGASAKELEGEEEGVGLDDPRIPVIRDIIEDYILPYLEADGGGIKIKGLVDDQLFIQYEGACGTCPSATTGTIMAIEALIQREVDPELDVVPV